MNDTLKFQDDFHRRNYCNTFSFYFIFIWSLGVFFHWRPLLDPQGPTKATFHSLAGMFQDSQCEENEGA